MSHSAIKLVLVEKHAIKNLGRNIEDNNNRRSDFATPIRKV